MGHERTNGGESINSSAASRRNLKAFGASLAATTLFGLSFLFLKVALGANGGRVFDLLSYRFVLAALIILILRQAGIIRVDYKAKGFRPLIALCLLNPVLYFTLETLGVNRVASSEAGMMLSILPVSTTIFGIVFLKERVTARQLFFALVSISGIALINICGYVPGASSNLGRFLLLVCVLTASSYGTYSRMLSVRYTPIERTAAMILTGAVFFTIVAIVMNARDGTAAIYIANLAKPGVILPVLYLSVGCSIGAFSLSNYAITHPPISRNAVMGNFSPVVSIAAGTLILSEQLYWYHVLGSAIILCGVIGTTLLRPRETGNTETSVGTAIETVAAASVESPIEHAG